MPDPSEFQCSVVTPERVAFDAPVVYANLPAHDGQLGVMRRHAPLLVQLGAGTLELRGADGQTRRYRVDGGFAQMAAQRLTLLSEKVTEPQLAETTQ